MDLKRLFLTVVIIALCAAALLGIGVFLFGTFGETELKILGTTVFFAFYSLTALCSAALYEKKMYVPLALLGMVTSAGALIMALYLIWVSNWVNEVPWKVGVTLGILAFSFAHAGLLFLSSHPSTLSKLIRAGTVVFIGIVALMLIFLTLDSTIFEAELFYRFLGVFAIIDVLGTIVTPLTRKL
jgi:hypothetical protein